MLDPHRLNRWHVINVRQSKDNFLIALKSPEGTLQEITWEEWCSGICQELREASKRWLIEKRREKMNTAIRQIMKDERKRIRR